jgi:hypothetical protein
LIRLGSRLGFVLFAAVNVVLHVIALGLSAYGIAPGTRRHDLAARIDYLSEYPLGWTLGWLSWIACIPALLAFLVLTARWRSTAPPKAALALKLAFIGAAIDLTCDALFIFLIPRVAQSAAPHGVGELVDFWIVERGVSAVSLIVANGLYSVAILILADTLPNRVSRLMGLAVGICGLLLSASAFIEHPAPTEITAGLTILLYCAWVIEVTSDLVLRCGAP